MTKEEKIKDLEFVLSEVNTIIKSLAYKRRFRHHITYDGWLCSTDFKDDYEDRLENCIKIIDKYDQKIYVFSDMRNYKFNWYTPYNMHVMTEVNANFICPHIDQFTISKELMKIDYENEVADNPRNYRCITSNDIESFFLPRDNMVFDCKSAKHSELLQQLFKRLQWVDMIKLKRYEEYQKFAQL